MGTSYAVKWRESDGRLFLGRLELGLDTLLLEGLHDGEPAVRRAVGYEEVTGFRVARLAEERIDGQPALVVERCAGNLAVTSTVTHAGVLQELVDRLAELGLDSPRRATVVIPPVDGSGTRFSEQPSSPAEAPRRRSSCRRPGSTRS